MDARRKLSLAATLAAIVALPVATRAESDGKAISLGLVAIVRGHVVGLQGNRATNISDGSVTGLRWASATRQGT